MIRSAAEGALAVSMWGLLACAGGRVDMSAYNHTPQWEVMRRPANLLHWRLVGSVPHGTDSYTEGLVFVGDRLFESVGPYGNSRVLEIDARTGAVLRTQHDPDGVPWPPGRFFGEGLAEAGGRLVQLSWRNHHALIWNLATFAREGDFAYDREGWGLCSDGKVFWRSDGSDALERHALTDFAPVGDPLMVRLGTEPVEALNELECIGDDVFANVWETPFVVRIDSRTGQVTGVLDLQPLVENANASGQESVLNGLAWNAHTHRLYVTGKMWSKMYVIEMELTPPAAGHGPTT